MTPRPLSLVRFDFEGLDKQYHHHFPFKPTDAFIFFGEIPNMPGHCVVVARNNPTEVHSGYHTENFIELTDEEV